METSKDSDLHRDRNTRTRIPMKGDNSIRHQCSSPVNLRQSTHTNTIRFGSENHSLAPAKVHEDFFSVGQEDVRNHQCCLVNSQCQDGFALNLECWPHGASGALCFSLHVWVIQERWLKVRMERISLLLIKPLCAGTGCRNTLNHSYS